MFLKFAICGFGDQQLQTGFSVLNCGISTAPSGNIFLPLANCLQSCLVQYHHAFNYIDFFASGDPTEHSVTVDPCHIDGRSACVSAAGSMLNRLLLPLGKQSFEWIPSLVPIPTRGGNGGRMMPSKTWARIITTDSTLPPRYLSLFAATYHASSCSARPNNACCCIAGFIPHSDDSGLGLRQSWR